MYRLNLYEHEIVLSFAEVVGTHTFFALGLGKYRVSVDPSSAANKINQ